MAEFDEYGQDESFLVPLLPFGQTSLHRPNGRPVVPMVKLIEICQGDTRMRLANGAGN